MLRMPDHLTIEQRHKNMAAIHSKDTKPEMIVRRYLWSHGFRYRLNHPRLPGRPDIVLRKYRTCIFVNGCFWHGHGVLWDENEDEKSLVSSNCCKIPRTNREFWVQKILRNRERDSEVEQKLAEMGWYSITIWECQLKDRKTLQPGEKSPRERTLESLAYTLNHLYLENHRVKHFSPQEDDGQLMAAEE